MSLADYEGHYGHAEQIQGRGRPIRTTTKLGRMLVNRQIKVYEACVMAGFSPRLMTEYIAGRRIIPPQHLAGLCNVLNCQPNEISNDLKENLTDSTGKPRNGARSVRDLDGLTELPKIPKLIPKPKGSTGIGPDILRRSSHPNPLHPPRP